LREGENQKTKTDDVGLDDDSRIQNAQRRGLTVSEVGYLNLLKRQRTRRRNTTIPIIWISNF